MTHPSETSLALFAGGEAAPLARWKIRRHLSRCLRCRKELEGFRIVRESLRESADEMPAEVNWNRLALEIRGNIRVGLAAGECVGPSEAEPSHWGWRTAATLVPVVLLLLVGWWLQPSRPRLAEAPQPEGIVLEATSGGIELRDGSRVLSLQHPDASEVMYTVSVQGAIRARYVDSETGQVTINHVYAQ